MAIELIAKIKQANNGTFKLMDAQDIELKDGSDLQTFIDNIDDMVNIEFPEYPPCDNIAIGDEQPNSEKYLLWVDTSGNEFSSFLQDKIIAEFSETFKLLMEEISELRFKNYELEARIQYLEENGATSPTPPDSGGSEYDFALLLENGAMITDELGNILAFEDGN